MGIVIDSNIFIKAEKGDIDLDQHIVGREQEDFFISVITASELLHGVWRAETPSVRTRRNAFVEAVLNAFPILPIDLSTARSHAQLWADLQTQGRMIGIHDSWIAAMCVAKGLKLVTGDIKAFERIPGLLLETWE
ncbi:MAG: type II toxin-antitoxin system VapC family toxin [Proteobacteria bacterium]|nr:type II toxin-antitoxin system VapC family toxin [Pseudomonadota bacterium]